MRTHPLAVLYGLVGVALTQQQQQQVTVAKSFTGWDWSVVVVVFSLSSRAAGR